MHKRVGAGRLVRQATLRQLQVFDRVVKRGSVTKAAEELRLTQPTVSAQLKKLGDCVGGPLFEQVGRQLYLTQEGELLTRTAVEVLDALARFEMAVDNLNGLSTGSLSLGVVTTAKYFAPRVLGEFSRMYPGIEVALQIGNHSDVLQRLHENRDDLYIVSTVPIDLEDRFQPFMPNPVVIVASDDHALVGKRNIPLERLVQERFILREEGSGVRRAVEAMFEGAGLELHTRMALSSNEAIKQAVVSGLGIGALSLHSVRNGGVQDRLRILDVRGFPLQRQWHVGYPAGKQLSVVAEAFRDYLFRQGRIMTANWEEAGVWAQACMAQSEAQPPAVD